MSIEEALAANTAALIENTKAHAKLAEVAIAAAGGKASASAKTNSKEEGNGEEEEEEKPKETAAEKKKRLAAEKKAKLAAEKKAAKTEAPELVAEMSAAALHKIAAAFMSDDLDAAERDANKANFVGGLAHLGAKKFSELADDSERARLAAYIGYWQAGLDVDFDAIDAEIEALSEGGEDDDPLG